MSTAVLLLIVMGLYLAVGAMFGAAFMTFGLATVDSSAAGAPMGFRLVIFPGAALLWPVLLAKWVAAIRRKP